MSEFKKKVVLADFVFMFCKLKRNDFPEVSLRFLLISIRRDIWIRTKRGGTEIHRFPGGARVGGEKRRGGDGWLGRRYINNLNQSMSKKIVAENTMFF